MPTILVFGANGQLGHDLLAFPHCSEVKVVGVGRGEADITDPRSVGDMFKRISPSLVINAAAYTKVDLAETEVEAAFLANESGPRVLASACAAARIPLVHISTDYVFDGSKLTPYAEDDPIAPLGVYGQSKAAGEAVVRKTLSEHIILRTSWVYGIYGSNFLKTMLRLAAEREELRVVADQIGCPTGTADLAEAILRIAPRLISGEPIWGTYHFAGSGVTSWHGFATEIVDAQAAFTNRRPRVTAISTSEYPTPARRPANSTLNMSRFAEIFGFRASGWQERTRQVVSSLLKSSTRAP